MKIEHPSEVLHIGRLRDGGMVITVQELLSEPVQSVEIVLSPEEVRQVVEYVLERAGPESA